MTAPTNDGQGCQPASGGTGAVQRELEKLVASGLVCVTHVGRQKHYQANAEAPVFDELRRIVVKTIGVVDPVREALDPLAPRITRALVFGSVAEGTDRASSDVDLLVGADDLTLEDHPGHGWSGPRHARAGEPRPYRRAIAC